MVVQESGRAQTHCGACGCVKLEEYDVFQGAGSVHEKG